MLDGFRILDLTDERGHLAGKILGDLGAEVIKVEPPAGDALRRRGPYVGGVVDVERSLPWLALNTSKLGVTVDLDSAGGRDTFRRLVATADVVLETAHPGALDELHIGYSSLAGDCPRLVWCAITPFGQTGPYASYRAHDLVVVGMGENAAMTGEPGLPPVRCTLPTSYFHACAEAAAAVAVALVGRDRDGHGELIDVSMQECQLATLVTGPGQYVLHGREPRRTGARIGRTREIWRCQDGYVTFGLRGGPARVRNLIATSEYMAEQGMQPEWMRAYDWSTYNHNTLSDDEIERFESAFAAFFATRTMRELYEQALRRRILLAPCNDVREVAEHPQLRDRGLFASLDYPELGASIEHPAFFAKSDRPGIGVRHRAPRLGEHNDLLLHEAPSSRPESDTASFSGAAPGGGSDGSGSRADGRRPVFDGVNVLEFGSGAAGPMATRYLTDQGARVVRVESTRRPDFLRALHRTDDDPRSLDRAPMFVLLNPGKQSIALDLARPEGVELARRLACWADVVTENFAPGVMARWGLDAASLRALKPELIYVSSCLFGQTGPQRTYPGFGGQGAAIAGFNHLTGRIDGEAHGPHGTITDSLSPRYVGLLIAAALLERRRTGEGRTIDVSQIETGVYSLSELLVRYAGAGDRLIRDANHDEWAAPHGVYPCRGEDRWLALAVRDDEQWAALVREMGEPSWSRDEALATRTGRLARRDELDELIAGWTRARDGRDLMSSLQAAGVEAGVVQTFADLLDDPQLAHRRHFVRLPHDHLGDMTFERMGFRLSAHTDRLRSAGPALGQHTGEVLAEILDLSAAEIERLDEQEVLQ